MTAATERSLVDGAQFDRPVGDFNWGPRRRWRSLFSAVAPLLLAVVGLLLIAIALTRLWI